MSDSRIRTFDAGGVIQTGQGRKFSLAYTGAPVDLRFDLGGRSYEVLGVSGGYVFKRNPAASNFVSVTITGVPFSTVQYFIGTDEEEFQAAAADTRDVSAGTVGNLADAVVGVAQVALIAPNAARKSLLIQAHHNNTNAVRVGATGVAAGAGARLTAGESISVTAKAAWYAISEGGNQTVCIIEESF